MLYVYYDILSEAHRGWALSELKNMSRREREHWLAMIKWRASAKTQLG